jgi:hypothetical protein
MRESAGPNKSLEPTCLIGKHFAKTKSKMLTNEPRGSAWRWLAASHLHTAHVATALHESVEIRRCATLSAKRQESRMVRARRRESAPYRRSGESVAQRTACRSWGAMIYGASFCAKGP